MRDNIWLVDGERAYLKKILMLAYWPAYFIVANICLNVIINHLYSLNLNLYGLSGVRLYIRSVNMYGLHGVLYKIGMGYAVVFFLAAIAFRLIFIRISAGGSVLATHGSAHFATAREIRNAGLIGSRDAGVICGGWVDPDTHKSYFLRHSGPEHMLVVAPTRSGKGVSLIIPTLLTWPHSVFCLDIKGENWFYTSGWRKENIGPCLRFEPTDPSDTCAKYNPLREIHIGTDRETAEVQQIASMLIDPDGKGLEDYWAESAFELMTGAITHECYAANIEDREPTLAGVRQTITSGDIQSTLEEWLTYEHTPQGPHPIVASVAEVMRQKADREVSGVFSTANAKLSLWLDPVIVKNTSASTFRVTDLVNSDKPVSLYVVVPPSDLTRLRPLLRLFVVQVVNGLTQKMQQKADGGISSGHKHKLLLMLDEFPQLRKMDQLQTALAQIAGYGLKAYIITQSYTQLSDVYGKDETVSANCNIHITFAPNDENSARIISDKCGKKTEITGNRNESGSKWAAGLFAKKQESVSFSHHERPLLYPDEVRRLKTAEKDKNGQITKPGEVLIFAAGTAPIRGIQTLYFKNAEYLQRTQIPPPENCPVLYSPLQEHPEPELPEDNILDEEFDSSLLEDFYQAENSVIQDEENED